MSNPGILLIEVPEGLGSHEADAALRLRALRGAGIAARSLVVGRTSTADVAFHAAVARAAAEPIAEVWVAGGCAQWRAVERVLARERRCRWWPTLVPGSGGEPDPGVNADALLSTGGPLGHGAFALAPVRIARERAPVALWDGEFVLAAGALRGGEGERLLCAFAAAAESRSGLDLVVTCDPDPELMAAARALGIGCTARGSRRVRPSTPGSRPPNRCCCPCRRR